MAAYSRRFWGAEAQQRYSRLLYCAKKIYGEVQTVEEKPLVEDYKDFLVFLSEYTGCQNLNGLTERDYVKYIEVMEERGAGRAHIRRTIRAARYWHDMNENSKTVFPATVADMLHLPEEVDFLGI